MRVLTGKSRQNDGRAHENPSTTARSSFVPIILTATGRARLRSFAIPELFVNAFPPKFAPTAFSIVDKFEAILPQLSVLQEITLIVMLGSAHRTICYTP